MNIFKIKKLMYFIILFIISAVIIKTNFTFANNANSSSLVIETNINDNGYSNNNVNLIPHTPYPVEYRVNGGSWESYGDKVVSTADKSGYFYVLASGDLYAVGKNAYGMLGVGAVDETFTTPVKVPNIPKVKKVFYTMNSTFITTINGDLYATGHNSSGQLGLGDKTNRTTFTKVNGINNVKQITSCRNLLYDTTYFLLENGDVYSCGTDSLGSSLFSTSVPIKIQQIPPIRKISSDYSTVQLITVNNELYSFGRGKTNLGIPETQYPKKNEFFTNVKDVLINKDSCFVLLENGDLYGISQNSAGELGLGHKNIVSNFVKLPINNVENFYLMGSYSYYSYALTKNGDLYSIGDNRNGQLCLGDTISRDSFTKITSIDNIKELLYTDQVYGCTYLLTENNEVYGFGGTMYNYGVLSDNLLLTPLKLNSFKNVYYIDFEYAISTSGKVYKRHNFKEVNTFSDKVPNNLQFTNEGSYNLEFRAYNPINNETLDIKSLNFTIDKTIPNKPTINLKDNVVTINDSSDNLSGVDRIEYNLGSNDWYSYLDPIILNGTEPYILAKVYDKAGNVSKISSMTLLSEPNNETPVINQILGNYVENGWTSNDVSIKVDAIGNKFYSKDTMDWILLNSDRIIDFKSTSASNVILLSNGDVYTFGEYQVLGTGSTTSTSIPVKNEILSSIGKVTKIFTTEYQVYCQIDDGRLYGFGFNIGGNLGADDIGDEILLPTLIPGVNNVKKIIGNFSKNIFLTELGEVFYAGTSLYDVNYLYPIKDDSLKNIVDIAINGFLYIFETDYFLDSNGKLILHGFNTYQTLGLPSYETPTLKEITSITNIKKIHSTINGSLLIESHDDAVYCNGSNTFGELGLGNTNPVTSIELHPYSGLINYIETSPYTVFISLKDGRVLSSGGIGEDIQMSSPSNYGQLGHGDRNGSSTFVEIPILKDAKLVNASRLHTTALLKDNTVLSWGAIDTVSEGISSSSLLGYETLGETTPKVIESLNKFKEPNEDILISTEGNHTLYFKSKNMASNIESDIKSITFGIDKTIPNILIQPNELKNSFSLYATDELSKISNIEYMINDLEWLSYTSSVYFTEYGDYNIKARSYDNAGNVSIIENKDIKFEPTPLEISLSTSEINFGVLAENDSITSVELNVSSGENYSISILPKENFKSLDKNNELPISNLEVRIDKNEFTPLKFGESSVMLYDSTPSSNFLHTLELKLINSLGNPPGIYTTQLDIILSQN